PVHLLLRRSLPYALAALALVGVRQARLAENGNLLLYDLAIELRPKPSASDLPIRVIAIEEDDLRFLGWPINDHLLADAIRHLKEARVAASGLDLYRDLGVAPGVQDLRSVVATAGPVVSVYSLIDGVKPIPGTPPTRQAYNDLPLDADGVVRRDLLHVRSQGPAGVTLPLRLLELWHGQAISPLRARWEAGPPPDTLAANSGGYTHLDEGGIQRMLPFHRPGSFQSWSLRALLAGQVPPERLRGTVVLIGSRAPSLRDLFAVPVGRLPWSPGERGMPGVDLHAHRLAALMAQERGTPLGIGAVPDWLNTLLLVGAITAGAALGEGLPNLRRSGQAVALVAVFGIAAGGLLLWQGGLWLNLTLPLAGLIATATAAWTGRGMEQQLQRQQLHRLLGQTISPEVAQELWQQREVLLAGNRFRARELFVTVLLADIEHVTAVAEGLPPEPLLDWLNQAMERLVNPIQIRGGLVNKFTGDGVLAVFGAPLSGSRPWNAAPALDAALAIRAEFHKLNGQLQQGGQPPVRLRLGLHSGLVVAGSIGSNDRWEYGVIGDVVNCAARIDSLRSPSTADGALPPSPNCRILMSGVTRDLLLDRPHGLRWKPWGVHSLSGRTRQEEIWELLDAHDPGMEAPP
ncbi:MAG: CHASE2 domain-containing protein, partial [Cyanobium sp.]